jgi:predicted dehydrogenase
MFVKQGSASCIATEKLTEYPWMKADELRVLMKANDAVGAVVASCNSPFHGDSLSIFGTKLGLDVDLWARSVIKHKPRTEAPASVGKNNLGMAGQFFSFIGTTASNSLKMAVGGVKVSAHYGFLSAFVKSILENTEPPVSDEEARENVRIVEEICNKIDQTTMKAG